MQRASSVVEARAIRRIVVSSLWRSFACNAVANLSSSGAAVQIWLEADEAADGLIFAAQGARVSAPAHASALEHGMAGGRPTRGVWIFFLRAEPFVGAASLHPTL